jgi:virulence-associated protein VagC
MKLKVTESGVVIPRAMLPDVEEVDVRCEGEVIIVTPICAPDDPIWDMGNDPVTVGYPDASQRHDRYVSEADP